MRMCIFTRASNIQNGSRLRQGQEFFYIYFLNGHEAVKISFCSKPGMFVSCLRFKFYF